MSSTMEEPKDKLQVFNMWSISVTDLCPYSLRNILPYFPISFWVGIGRAVEKKKRIWQLKATMSTK